MAPYAQGKADCRFGSDRTGVFSSMRSRCHRTSPLPISQALYTPTDVGRQLRFVGTNCLSAQALPA